MRFHGLEQDDRRRAPRVPGQFLVMVQGVDGGGLLVFTHAEASNSSRPMSQRRISLVPAPIS